MTWSKPSLTRENRSLLCPFRLLSLRRYKVCLLVSATSTGGVDQAALAGSSGTFGARPDPSELVASNPSAFGIIQSLLAECTPPVEAVCLQVNEKSWFRDRGTSRCFLS